MMNKPSTRSLGSMPDIATVRRISQSIAMLDAILSPDRDMRYYLFNAAWSSKEQMASMSNGGGDEYFILFNAAGAAIKGFDHEAPMTPYRVEPERLWPGLYDSLPSAFESFLHEPAFSMDDATFCIWRAYEDSAWRCGVADFEDDPDPDGSGWMLLIFDGLPETYRSFAREYYERDVALEAVKQIYRHAPLTDDLVVTLNPELRLDDLADDAKEIGYPVGPA